MEMLMAQYQKLSSKKETKEITKARQTPAGKFEKESLNNLNINVYQETHLTFWYQDQNYGA